ncbi:MAG TPA: 2-C-methyl-D-erythritol 4-phosphate cytidylyltransferase [Acidobacteriota bacterium]|nr:2-C-methyl-D-erythritol 4-phosphate cytidylyltransferase [Acidobacteriota bacterium]
MNVTALIVAAGKSERFGGAAPKQFRELCGRPLLTWTISRFETASSIDRIVLVVSEEHLLFAGEKVVDPYGFSKVIKIVKGGDTRQESVRLGLESLPVSTRFVAIHDGARPVVSPRDIDRVVEAATVDRAAMLALPAGDTVKRVRDKLVISTLDRDSLYLAQTPQVFQYDLIVSAHREFSESDAATDDAALVERKGFKVRVVEPESPNIKVTTPEDLVAASAFLQEEGHE